MGKSGRAMIEALIAGETNPAKLASLADRRIKGISGETHRRYLIPPWLRSQVEPDLGPCPTARADHVDPGRQKLQRARHRLRDRL